MKIINCRLPNVYEIYTKRFSDSRGSFTEAFNSKEIKNITGKEFKVCQVNKSISKKGVLRGLHFQKNSPQSKIVLVTKGRIQDVIVNIDKKSKYFGKFETFDISSKKGNCLFIPSNYAHGFLALDDLNEVIYLVDEFWDQKDEKTLMYNDKELNIDWALKDNLNLSKKDLNGINLGSL